MFINDEKYLKFLIEHQLNANQFLFCYCLATTDRNHGLLAKYTNLVGRLNAEEMADLVERGYLNDFNTNGESYNDLIIVTDKFKEEIFVDTEEAFEELWKTYPMHLQSKIDGRDVLAKTTSKGMEDLRHRYAKYIGNNTERHQRVMEGLKWAIEQRKVTIGIEKFVLNRIWDDWLTEKEEKSSNEYGNDYNIEVD